MSKLVLPLPPREITFAHSDYVERREYYFISDYKRLERAYTLLLAERDAQRTLIEKVHNALASQFIAEEQALAKAHAAHERFVEGKEATDGRD